MYTSTNATSGNGIIAMGYKSDGSVTELPGSPYPTGDAGDAAEGDFDTQWPLRIEGDYLLAVNAGANPTNGSLSVFKVNRTNGSLVRVDQNPATPPIDNMNSHGIRAVSFATATVKGITWVVVANQHSNALYKGDPPRLVGKVQNSTSRNLAIFTLNPATGMLVFRNIGPVYESGQHGGPTTVEFNPAGTKLATSTDGIPHGFAPDVDLTVQKSGRLYIYEFADGVLSQTGVYEEAGISANIGFSWSPDGQYIYLSNAAIHSSKEDNSITVHDGTTAKKVQNFATAGPNDGACWTLISLDHSKLYVASFSTNVISVFNIGANGQLDKSLTPNYFARGGGIPEYDTKDMYETKGYLHVLGALESHTITTFKTSPDGVLSEIAGSPYHIPSSVGKTVEQHAFLGLTGFDK